MQMFTRLTAAKRRAAAEEAADDDEETVDQGHAEHKECGRNFSSGKDGECAEHQAEEH